MAFDKKQFRRLVRDTLKELEPQIPYSLTAEELLLLTAAQESAFGTYLQQIKGPAQGVFQMEPNTWRDIYTRFLWDRPELLRKVSDFATPYINFDLCANGNVPYQIVQARVYYWRIPEALPEIHFMPMELAGHKRLTQSSVYKLAKYWKEYYNTALGRGTIQQAILNYMRYANE